MKPYTSRYIRIPRRAVFRFKCIRCDKCCGTGPNIALTVFDVVRMARFLRIHWRAFLKNYVNVVVADIAPFMALRGDSAGKCLFLAYKPSGETLCTIYPARPMRCRLYPVVVESLNPSHLYLDPECPGLGEGGVVAVPPRLLDQYLWERREHYARLYRLLSQGLEPLEALEKLLEEAWREAENGAEWASLDWLESLEDWSPPREERGPRST